MAEPPNTYTQLLDPLSTIDPLLLSEETLSHITRVSSCFNYLRTSFQTTITNTEDPELHVRGANILDILQQVEEIGVAGWVRWLEQAEREIFRGHKQYPRDEDARPSKAERMEMGEEYERTQKRSSMSQKVEWVQGKCSNSNSGGEADKRLGRREENEGLEFSDKAAGLRSLNARCESADENGEEKPLVMKMVDENEDKGHALEGQETIEELQRLYAALQTRPMERNALNRTEGDALRASGLRSLPAQEEKECTQDVRSDYHSLFSELESKLAQRCQGMPRYCGLSPIVRYFHGIEELRKEVAERWPRECRDNAYIVYTPNIHSRGIYGENSGEESDENVENGWRESPHFLGGADIEGRYLPKATSVTPLQDGSDPRFRFLDPTQQGASVLNFNTESSKRVEDMRTKHLATYFSTPVHEKTLSCVLEAHTKERKVESLGYELESLRYAYAEAQRMNREWLSREQNPYQLYKRAVNMMRGLANSHSLTFEDVYQALKNEDRLHNVQYRAVRDAEQQNTLQTVDPTPSRDHEQATSSTACEEPSMHSIYATGFYFFPTVSTVVLLTSPKTYLEWPRHTTLRQLRHTLHHRKVTGIEDYSNNVRVREILETRDAMGIPDPDMSDGRMMLINIPEDPKDSGNVDIRDLQGKNRDNTVFWEKKMWDETGEHPSWHGKFARFD
jgi:hypothetical protein